MQHDTIRKVFVLGATVLVSAGLLGGCVYRRETIPASSPPTTVIVQPSERVVTYPEGRYELRGQGTASEPFYWVWIPTGVTPPNPPPPPRVPR